MKTKVVQKDESLEFVANETFIFCDELKKGFIKRDLSPLNTTDYSFTNIASLIEVSSLEELESTGLNTVIFVNGEEKISVKMNKIIESIITTLPSGITATEIEQLFAQKRAEADYFDLSLLESIDNRPLVSRIVLSNFIEPKTYKWLGWYFYNDDLNNIMPNNRFHVNGLTYDTDTLRHHFSSYNDSYKNPRIDESIEIIFNSPERLNAYGFSASPYVNNNGTDAFKIEIFDENNNLIYVKEHTDLFNSSIIENNRIDYLRGHANPVFSLLNV